MPDFLFFVGCGLALSLLVSRRRPFAVLLLLLPGTFAHELAHYLVALVTGGRPRAPDLVPRRTSDEHWQMGEVQFHAGPLRTTLVALAPLYLVPLLAWGLWDWGSALASGWAAFAGYCFGLSAWSMWPSRTDWALVGNDPVGFFGALAVIVSTAWWVLSGF